MGRSGSSCATWMYFGNQAAFAAGKAGATEWIAEIVGGLRLPVPWTGRVSCAAGSEFEAVRSTPSVGDLSLCKVVQNDRSFGSVFRRGGCQSLTAASCVRARLTGRICASGVPQ